MGRLLVHVDPGTGIVPGMLADAWNSDDVASAAGSARVESAGGHDFFPGMVELVIIPLAVNLASSAGYDLLRKLVTRLRDKEGHTPELEVADVPANSGDLIIVIRAEITLP